MKKTNLPIKNIPDITLEKIDAMSKKNGLSRSDFIKKTLEKLVQSEGVSELDSRFHELIKKNIGVLDLNTKALKYFCEENLIDITHLLEN